MNKKSARPWGVFVAIILAMLFGAWAGESRSIFGISYYTILDTFSIIFLNALTLVVVPLVSSSIISGIARIGNDQDFGRLGVKMFSFYIGTSFLAILIGLILVNLIHPGSSFHAELPTSLDPSLLQGGSSELSSIFNVILQIIPSNIFDALSQGKMLSLIFFCLLFGYSLSKIEKHPSSILLGFFQGVFQTMLHITKMIMKFLPYGVFCLVGKVFATSGLQSIASLALFVVTVLLGLSLFMFLVLPLLLRFIGRIKHPFRQFKAMTPSLITAFSTSSSSATLPITIECVEKRAGVSNRICSLVVPLGTSLNMSGTALYECVAAVFVAQAYGIELSLVKQFLIVFLSLVASIGVAGIPSASLVAILIILRAIGLPLEGIALFIAVDRLLDMCRTTVNVFSDSCCAVLVARSEGEQVLQDKL